MALKLLGIEDIKIGYRLVIHAYLTVDV